MNSSKIKNTRKYRPIKINESLRDINKKILYKFNELDYIIYAKWPEMVGVFFKNHSEPQKISSIPSTEDSQGNLMYEKYLHVNVSPAAALEFQHFQNKIIEKINSFFGYKAINGIKIHQKFIKKEEILPISNKLTKNDNITEKNKIKSTTSAINDKKLKESLIKLGLSLSNKK